MQKYGRDQEIGLQMSHSGKPSLIYRATLTAGGCFYILSWVFPHSVCVCVRSVTQSCLTLCDPMDRNPPGSSVHGISQVRIVEWVAIPFIASTLQTRCIFLGGRLRVWSSIGWLFTSAKPERAMKTLVLSILSLLWHIRNRPQILTPPLPACPPVSGLTLMFDQSLLLSHFQVTQFKLWEWIQFLPP